jgi:glycosyltransferase involved in cell wall biosynthesis
VEILIPADIRFPLERANGVQIVKTAAALARTGVRTTLLVRKSDPRSTESILALYGVAPSADLIVRRMPLFHRRGAFLIPRLMYLLWTSLTAWTAQGRSTVVFTRDLQLADLLLAIPWPGRRRLIYEAHAVEAFMYRERGQLYGTGEVPHPHKLARIERRERRVWRHATGFVSTTEGIRATFTERYGPRPYTRVIPNGCDVPQERRFPGLSTADPPRILYAGQLYPWKGVDVLVEAMTQLPHARLVILGGLDGEPDTNRVRQLVEARGLRDRTEMPGTVPQVQVAHELTRATVVVVPFLKSVMTEHHTSPIKAFEAMAMGRPIVCTDLPSSREFLRHDENAWLVPPGDAGALAQALAQLLNDRSQAERLAARAYADAPAFSWDARARQLRGLIEELA